MTADTEAAIESLAAVVARALADGVLRLWQGAPLDAAIAASIERLEDERARAKWPDYRGA